MFRTPLLSTYRQGENRVTASLLAVLERLGITATERLLRAAMLDDSLRLLSFSNQPGAGAAGIPDGEISASVRILIETKTIQGAYEGPEVPEQIQRHLRRLNSNAEHYARRFLLVLTPDVAEPSMLRGLRAQGVAWCSFRQLNEAIGRMIEDEPDSVSEQQRFLLRELVWLFRLDGLLGSPLDTVIVAASWAYPWYLTHAAYVCQPGRSFRNVQRMGFYADGEIKTHLPLVRNSVDNVLIADEAVTELARSATRDSDACAAIVRAMLAEDHEGERVQIILLSPPEDPETVRLDQTVTHQGQGRGSAWTMGQRYVAVSALMDQPQPTTTAELDARLGKLLAR